MQPMEAANEILNKTTNDASGERKVVSLLDDAGPLGTLEIIKDLHKLAGTMHKDLPQMAIDGLADHLGKEAGSGVDISDEFNSLKGPEKRAVTADLIAHHPSNVHIVVDKGELKSATAEKNGVETVVYSKEGLMHKIEHPKLPGQ